MDELLAASAAEMQDSESQPTRESSRVKDGKIMCRHCSTEMEEPVVICPTCQEPNDNSAIAREMILENVKNLHLESVKRLTLVVRPNYELRGQKSWKTRRVERARRKLKKAKDAGYETVAQRYSADRELREQLLFNMGV